MGIGDRPKRQSDATERSRNPRAYPRLYRGVQTEPRAKTAPRKRVPRRRAGARARTSIARATSVKGMEDNRRRDTAGGACEAVQRRAREHAPPPPAAAAKRRARAPSARAARPRREAAAVAMYDPLACLREVAWGSWRDAAREKMPHRRTPRRRQFLPISETAPRAASSLCARRLHSAQVRTRATCGLLRRRKRHSGRGGAASGVSAGRSTVGAALPRAPWGVLRPAVRAGRRPACHAPHVWRTLTRRLGAPRQQQLNSAAAARPLRSGVRFGAARRAARAAPLPRSANLTHLSPLSDASAHPALPAK